LNAKVKFSGKFPNYKLDATASVRFSFSCFIRDVKQHVFAKNNSQCCLTDYSWEILKINHMLVINLYDFSC